MPGFNLRCGTAGYKSKQNNFQHKKNMSISTPLWSPLWSCYGLLWCPSGPLVASIGSLRCACDLHGRSFATLVASIGALATPLGFLGSPLLSWCGLQWCPGVGIMLGAHKT